MKSSQQLSEVMFEMLFLKTDFRNDLWQQLFENGAFRIISYSVLDSPLAMSV